MNRVRKAGVPAALVLDSGGKRDEIAIAPATPDQLQTDR
jgi:hypothetical protein